MTNIPPINCEEALARLLDFLDRELDPHRHAEMEHHLEVCRACYSRAEFEKRLKARLAEAGTEKPSEEFESRIRRLFGTS